MALAERADTIVDFSDLAPGTTVTLLNIGPDEPFGGGRACGPGEDPEEGAPCDFIPADPASSGQVMRFVVNEALNGKGMTDPLLQNGKPSPQAATDPANLALNAEPALLDSSVTRQVSLNELDSEIVCVTEDNGNLVQLFCEDEDLNGDCENLGDPIPPESQLCEDKGGEPFGPLEALLGTVTCEDADGNVTEDPFDGECPEGSSVAGKALKWTAPGEGVEKVVPLGNGSTVNVWVTENPEVGATEEWEMYNFTADAHPIHLHLVRFEVLGRIGIDGSDSVAGSNDPLDWETGFKDTFISYPDEISRIKAKFDIEGLYVWHCHIVEHEDNEMMRPYAVGLPTVE
jgi:FtsP/CotA-like multicopper oxidase with cupredoxin domain